MALAALVHRAILLDPPQLTAIRQVAPDPPLFLRTYSFLLLFGALACRGIPLPVDELAAVPYTDAAAIVSADRAVFVFPVESREIFGWPADTPDSRADKYAWGITVLAGDTAFLPGGQAYRFAHPAPFTSLLEVVAAAPPRLLYNPGGMVQQLDERARVSMLLSEGRVIVILHGAAQIARVFRDRPLTVRFGVVAPLEPIWRETIVTVQYRDD